MSRPLLELRRTLYDALIADLARSGRGVKESGAFLLGVLDGEQRRVISYLMYEQVAPESSRKHSYVAFTAQEMARAWDHCYAMGLHVVADVHTHPGGPAQSVTDRTHPIVSVAGHVALIVPRFAQRAPEPIDLGVHIFEGSGRWRSLFKVDAQATIFFTD